MKSIRVAAASLALVALASPASAQQTDFTKCRAEKGTPPGADPLP